MKNPPKYPIPLTWGDSGSDIVATLPWDTLVLPFPWTIDDDSFVVQRIKGSWSKHVPEKKPLFRVDLGRISFSTEHRYVEAAPALLGTLPVGSKFIVERPVEGLSHIRRDGRIHGVRAHYGTGSILTFCDESVFAMNERALHALETTEPLTCSTCAQFKTAWVRFVILPHIDPRLPTQEEKKRLREVLKIQRRSRGRSVYDWLRMPDPHSKPTPKPAPARPPLPERELYEELEVDARERKLARRRESEERFRESKRRHKGY